MATVPADRTSFANDQQYFTRLAVLVAFLIVIGFAQFSLRGLADWRAMPLVVHLHSIAMLTWLGLFIAQNAIAEHGNFALHRRVGRIGGYLVAVIMALGVAAGLSALHRHGVPPFFTDSYFLALTSTEALLFGGLVYFAIARRRDTQAHRRFMFCALAVITEPALGRILPMPMLAPWGGWAILVLQLALMGVIALHDRRVLGRVHPATLASMGILIVAHTLIEAAARSETVIGLAERIAAAG